MKTLIAIVLWLVLFFIFLSLFRINQYENNDDITIIDRKKGRGTPRSE